MIKFEGGKDRGDQSGKLAKFTHLIRHVRNWPRTLLDHLQMIRADYVCQLRNGLSFEVRGGTDDRHIIFEVFVERIYPVQATPGSVVVDVGAHIGCFSILMAQQGARVFSFEPFLENFAALGRNLRLNGLADIRLFQIAISSERENRKMFLPDNPTYSGRYSLHPGRGGRTINVPCMSLDDVVRENNLDHIDLLKLDCQGSEYEILYGASADTLARTAAIIVECEFFEKPAHWSVAGLTGYLKERGFTANVCGSLVYAIG